ncbi:MAG: HAMP domain-containing histidine kinase [Oscillospiraceae bacterium]|jgi:signal transduction histidine kinase|nr:HAMP domain-containing histidine kinase [Oscillospiraceae bacterium]
MAAVTICVTAGHYLLSLLDLSGLWQTLFSLWIGFGLFAFTGFLIHSIGSRSRHEDHDMEQHGFMLEAMERIAQGDFSVFLPTDDRAHAKVAEAINTMAKNLGDMETMRQDFISNVSHEIQSPLTSIGGFAKLLKNDSLSPEQRKHYADIIETESNRLSSLSENLLKLSNLDNNKIPLNKADLKLDKQIESIVLTLEPQWSAKNINLEADIQKCAINGDRDLLSQVWINLLNNAIKFTPENGEITISLAEENGDVIVKIIDTGLGIAPEDKAHIFERFYKADKSRDRSFGGNGLGLSIVKKIVELHGGSITVESEKGKGTTFSVILPQK